MIPIGDDYILNSGQIHGIHENGDVQEKERERERNLCEESGGIRLTHIIAREIPQQQ